MRTLRYALIAIFAGLGGLCHAQIGADNLPPDTKWYVHADLKALRTASSAKPLYDWLDGEVFVEVHAELGIDLKEAEAITAFADSNLGTIVVVDGPIAEDTRDKLLALAAADATLNQFEYGGKSYYHASESGNHKTGNESLDDLQDSAWFTFDVKNKVIVTSDENQLKALLDSGGRLPGNHGRNGELFVLTADHNFVQAGALTNALDDDDDWDSNILRNTEQVALLVSGRDDLLAVEAQLVSREPQMAKSLGSIANGLLSLQALSSDLDPDLRNLLSNTRVEVKDKVLSVNLVIDAKQVVAMLNDQ